MENVFETATKFIERNRNIDPKTWKDLKIASASNEIQNVFKWSSEINLYDIPLVNKKTRERSGYLLISESKELPPVIEYATEGLSLKEQIDGLVTPALYASEIDATPKEYHFITSTEIYVEIFNERSKESFLINVPDLFVIQKESIDSFNRQAREEFNNASIDEQWYALEDNDSSGASKIVLNKAKPTRYQQNCDSYSLDQVCKIDLSEPKTYCSPRRISGCVPVAWAMLLSAWKRMNFEDSSKIWKGSSTWNIEWPSWQGTVNPSKSAEVESTIWKLHDLMDTTATGGTSDSKTIEGAKIFSTFDMSWKFSIAVDQDFSFAQKIIQAGQPFLFDGYGKWSSIDKKFSNSVGNDKGGHGVVAYGYDKTDKMLLVAMGWGTGTPNKWIHHDQYSSRGYTYRVKSEESRTNIYEVQ